MQHAAQDISHWYAEMFGAETLIPQRDPLIGAASADVAIVGAGYTGLWTAYELLKSRPGMRVAVLEAKFAGYGPSGRNGGAAIAQVVGSRKFWNKRGGPQGAVSMERAVQDGVDQIGAVIAKENIDCDYSKNGVLMLARTSLEEHHFRQSVEEDRKWGFGPEDTLFLESHEVTARVNAQNVLGAKWSSHCASIDPAKLVRGLAERVEALGGVIYEDTRVVSMEPGRAVCERGLVDAPYIVRATEAYTGWIKDHKRAIVPVHTTMIATEPIPDHLWSDIGWDSREAILAEHPFLHLQHTPDHRITIGGDDPRLPYRFGSGTSRDVQPDPALSQHYLGELLKLFPALEGTKIARSWSGVFGAPRDWAPSVGLDEKTGLAWAGGYVGEGVVASNMAGRTLRDLILKQNTEMTSLPWVRKHPRNWEPEPIRYIGSHAIFLGRSIGEKHEKTSGKSSKIVQIANTLAGFSGNLG
ncbi:FAD-dependent oxidoreductase [Arthrobacter sp. Cr_A7]|uniref:NAD(P)/FAD-dependent oxidoreductase n=1 Tax=Arthrobacter sp. Cr_A7 TaxID=3031017 RepID=UPI0023DA2108|nr:FAD-dependent oxidoreductase [Arthrobacter sp. Cr_A7]